MIDIHAHIIPRVDDGPTTIEASIELAQEAVRNGITELIATPHHKNGVYDNERERVIEQVRDLQSILDERQIPLLLHPSQEIHVYDNIIEDLKEYKLLSLDPHFRYILLELPHDHVPNAMEHLLYEIQLLGITAIIPHPERNIMIRKQPNLLYQLVKKGALAQITAASIIGKFGKEIQQFSYKLIEHHMCHVIASDAHRANKRGVHLREAYDEIADQYGLGFVNQLKQNADLIFRGQDIFVEPPFKIEKKKKLFDLFRR